MAFPGNAPMQPAALTRPPTQSFQVRSRRGLTGGLSGQGDYGRFSFDAGNLTYLSYGWQSDASTIYEVDVESANLDNFQTVASNLASNGYILTAIGGESTDGLLLVGTRVKGNTTPRPMRFQSFLNPPPVQMNIEGYAIVGLVNTPAGDSIWVGER